MASLALSFANSFAPERIYLAQMLQFLSKMPQKMTQGDISKLTGIPIGASSGKVAPTLNYLKGMWAIESTPDDNWYKLTPFGKIVLNTDILFSQIATQIVCHANMCDKTDGAILYNKLFTQISVNKKYQREALVKSFANNVDSHFTALCGMYTSAESFKKSRILDTDKKEIWFYGCPKYPEYTVVYGALISHLVNKYFADKGQISVDDFIQKTEICKILGWKEDEFASLMESLSAKGYIKLDKHILPVVFSMLKDEGQCWEEIYIDQI